ncbi:MAG: hypothetical protein WD969_03455, partial [Paracoccaceae bacterium]
HDMLLGRMRRALHARRNAAMAALRLHAPDWRFSGAEGGGGLWVEAGPGLDARLLTAAALRSGVVIEPGDVFFGGAVKPKRFFRLGFSVISEERIEEGVIRLVRAAREVEAGRFEPRPQK